VLLECEWDVFQGERHERENAARQLIELRGSASFETILHAMRAFILMR
jgi:hypothetical protein